MIEGVSLNPTSTNVNGTTEFYINSEFTGDSTFFNNDTIQCNTINCHIVCDMENGCNSLTVDASMSDILIIECNNVSSCSNIQVTSSKTNTHIICNESYACYQSKIHSDSVTDSLSISCNGLYSCSSSQINCPTNELYKCNIECMTDDSCSGVAFYVSDKFTKNLFVDCSTSDSCTLATVNCDDTMDATYLQYNSVFGYWKCQDYDCCPIIFDTITCGTSACDINCRSQRCANRLIDATMSTSLTLDCSVNDNVFGCFTSIIKCPTGNDTSCDISCTQANSCNSVDITTGLNNKMNDFILDCSAYYGCRYTDLKITSNNVTNVEISCNGGSSCRYLAINIGAIMDTFTFICYDTQSCGFAPGYKPYLSSPSIGTMIWNCTRYACQSAEMTIDNSVIDSFSLLCHTTRPCPYIQLIAANTVINDLTIECGDGTPYEQCIDIDIDVQIGRNVNIECISEESCKSGHFDLYSVSKDVDMNIICINTAGSEPYFGACSSAYFYLYGYNGNKMNNISISCGKYDCLDADFITTDFNQFDALCWGNSSCDGVKIDAADSNILNVKCDNVSACAGASIYCPYYDISVCNIICASLDMSCDNTHIHVDSSYAYGYLNLICPSYGTCNSLDTICQGGKSFNTMLYDNSSEYGYNGYYCPNWSENLCCPYFVNISTTTAQTTTAPVTTVITSTTAKLTTTSEISTTAIASTTGSISTTTELTYVSSEVSTTKVVSTTGSISGTGSTAESTTSVTSTVTELVDTTLSVSNDVVDGAVSHNVYIAAICVDMLIILIICMTY